MSLKSLPVPFPFSFCPSSLTSDNYPLGLLLKNADSRVVRYGIMNTFSFPLGIKDDLNSSQKRVAELKDIPWITGKTSRQSHYAKHLELIRSVEHVEQLAGFKTRLIDYVSKSPNLKNIVICGYIAQSMYLYSFNQEIPAYNVPISLKTTSKRNMKLLFVNHPSEKNKVWDFDRMKLDN